MEEIKIKSGPINRNLTESLSKINFQHFRTVSIQTNIRSSVCFPITPPFANATAFDAALSN
jgi:hypothetical protein